LRRLLWLWSPRIKIISLKEKFETVCSNPVRDLWRALAHRQ
jgi:hypothetical protein